MSSPDEDLPPQRLRVMQLVASALLLGVVTFLTVALIIVLTQTKGSGLAPAGDLPMISVVAVVFLAVEAPLAFLVPGFLTRSAVRQIASGTWRLPPGADPAALGTDAAKLLAVRQTTLLVGLALLEGAAFFGCIAFLLEARPFALGVVLVPILLMLVKFPTEGRVRAWLERQAGQLAELRQQGDVAADR